MISVNSVHIPFHSLLLHHSLPPSTALIIRGVPSHASPRPAPRLVSKPAAAHPPPVVAQPRLTTSPHRAPMSNPVFEGMSAALSVAVCCSVAPHPCSWFLFVTPTTTGVGSYHGSVRCPPAASSPRHCSYPYIYEPGFDYGCLCLFGDGGLCRELGDFCAINTNFGVYGSFFLLETHHKGIWFAQDMCRVLHDCLIGVTKEKLTVMQPSNVEMKTMDDVKFALKTRVEKINNGVSKEHVHEPIERWYYLSGSDYTKPTWKTHSLAAEVMHVAWEEVPYCLAGVVPGRGSSLVVVGLVSNLEWLMIWCDLVSGIAHDPIQNWCFCLGWVWYRDGFDIIHRSEGILD